MGVQVKISFARLLECSVLCGTAANLFGSVVTISPGADVWLAITAIQPTL